jgi:general secretion pathway protein G
MRTELPRGILERSDSLVPLPVLRERAGVRGISFSRNSRSRESKTLTLTLSRSTGRGDKMPKRFNSCRPGFSLVEFTAVLALMAIVATIVAVSVRPLMVKGKQDAARTEIAHICAALDAFYNTYGRYPTNEEGLGILRQKTEKLTEPLLTHDPVDPWGTTYQYNTPGREAPYEVICFGADGRPGGDGADKDIGSWNLKDTAGK